MLEHFVHFLYALCPEVSQLAFTFILTLASSVKRYDESVQNGGWIKSETFSYFPYPFTELAGKTLGIFGYGQIGKKVADIEFLSLKKIFENSYKTANDK